MKSRKDQVHAHSFMMGRLVSSVQRVDVDGPDEPVARTSKGTIGGLVLAAVVGVVIALFGVIVPAGGGSKSWETQGTLVIDSATGARYLFVAGQLRPALNVTSARLVAGTRMTIQTVGDADLRGVPVGAAFGIVDAPDAVPTAAGLATGAWSGCAVTQGNGPDPAMVLDVGRPVPVTGLTAQTDILVTGPDGTDYLLWDGRRLRVVAGHGVLPALGYAAVAPMPVTAAFLDAVPQGPDLVAPTIEAMGDAGPTLAGQPSRIGQLFADAAGRHYVLTSAGLTPLSATVFALLSGDPTVQLGAYGGAAVTTPVLGPADLAAHTAPTGGPLSDALAALPATPPHALAVRRGDAVCVTLRPGAGLVSDGIGTTTVDSVTARATPPDTGTGIEPSCTPADLVGVPPGTGALVSAAPAGGGTGQTDYLVTDDGVKYPIPAPSVLSLLGYSATSQVILPATVLALLPTGPSLDPVRLADGGVVAPAASPSGCT